MRCAVLIVVASAACVPTGDFDGGLPVDSGSGGGGGMTGAFDASTGWDVAPFAGSGLRGSQDGPPGVARFDDPRGLAIDGAGNLYVADRGNRAVRKIDPQGNVTTLAGAGAFYGPEGVAVDRAGNVYVADTQDQCVYRIGGIVVTHVAGRCRGGDAGFFQCTDIGPGSGGRPTDATMGAPGGMVVDEDAGVLLIADAQNKLVRFLSLSRPWLGTVAGRPNTMGLSDGTCGPNWCCGSGSGGGFGGCGAEHLATFREPVGVGLAPNGELWVADRQNCAVRRVTEPHASTCRMTTAVGDTSCGAGLHSLNGPSGVAVAPDGQVYVTDTANQRVVRLELTAPPTRRVIDVTRPGQVSNPWGLVADASGRLFVVDNGTNTVRVLTKSP